MSSTVLSPIRFHEDGIDKNGELEITENHLVFKSGFSDKTKLAYKNIRKFWKISHNLWIGVRKWVLKS